MVLGAIVEWEGGCGGGGSGGQRALSMEIKMH